MRAGIATTIRFNPKDCMAVVDVIEAAGLMLPGMTFSSAASLAITMAFQEMMKQGKIPERDGFEYTEIMSKITAKGNSKTARRISDNIYRAAMAGDPVAVSVMQTPSTGNAIDPEKRYFFPRDWEGMDEPFEVFAARRLKDHNELCIMVEDKK